MVTELFEVINPLDVTVFLPDVRLQLLLLLLQVLNLLPLLLDLLLQLAVLTLLLQLLRLPPDLLLQRLKLCRHVAPLGLPRRLRVRQPLELLEVVGLELLHHLVVEVPPLLGLGLQLLPRRRGVLLPPLQLVDPALERLRLDPLRLDFSSKSIAAAFKRLNLSGKPSILVFKKLKLTELRDHTVFVAQLRLHLQDLPLRCPEAAL
mmetsp:Transcript_4193/g.13412  ORF Transcript_4193/g.13412 Transcript_4193/m.13412 type:complete len:205 (-) Transcript_4193:273-887(-)